MKAIKPLKPKFREQPLISLCVMFRDNRDTLPALLDSVRGHFDEFIFCDTGSTDGSRGIIDTFLKGAQGKCIEFEWCDDFAQARQANFEAASGRWRMFLDSDDQFVGGEKLRTMLRKIEVEHRGVEGVFIQYDYDHLEELRTMRLVKWSPEWHWVDAIHERLVKRTHLPDGGFIQFSKEIAVRHKRKTAEEKDVALRRNARIAEREYKTTTDPEYKSRLARTIAMELKLDGKKAEAMPFLEEVYRGYPQHPEGKQAAADLSRFEASEGNLQSALQWAKKAGPSYEAIVYSAMKEDQKAIAAQTKASVIPQQTTHEGFIFEKVSAPLCQAVSGLRSGYAPSAVENVVNTVRSDLRMHPMVVELTQGIRRAIDRITILVPGTPQPFDGSSGGSMLGGSEEAVVYLSRALAKLGRQVRVFGVLPPLSLPGIDKDGVDYQHFSDFKVDDEHGCLVVWRSLGLVNQLAQNNYQLKKRIEAGDESVVLPTGIGRVSLWLHDRSMGGNNPEYVAALVGSACNSVVVLSDHHRRCIERELTPDHKVNFVKLSNGIVGEDFIALDWSQRDPNRVIYSSCPSRGLEVLLDQWPQIKEACPQAYLDIYYDWSMIEQANPDFYRKMVDKVESLRDADVIHHGGVGHEELHQALASAGVWAYPHFRNTDVETFCISAVKATAAGAQVVCSRHGALPEVAPHSRFVDKEKDFAHEVILAILNPSEDEYRKELRDDALLRFDWGEVAKRFSAEWTCLPK